MAKRGTDYGALAQRVRFGMADGMATRPVRRWTVDKLAILAYYLPSFAAICSKQAGGWYFFDGFAGSGVNAIQGEEWYKGSALIGLSVSPAATGAILIEQDRPQADALATRASGYATPAHIEHGNANTTTTALLREHFGNRHLPGFCVLDPEGLELAWDTVRAVANHRLSEYSPYELMIYFSTPGVARVGGRSNNLAYAARLSSLFGTKNGDWMAIAEDYEAGRLEPGRAGSLYRALYRRQVEALGYSYVIDRPVESERGHLVYHLIMATNNEVGAEILSRASEVAFLNNLPLPRG